MAIRSRYLAYVNSANRHGRKSNKVADVKGGSRKASILGKMQRMKKEGNSNE